VVPRVRVLLAADDSGLPVALHPVLTEACAEIEALAVRIRAVDKQLQAQAAQMPVVARLLTIPGIGPLTATALVGLVGDVMRFATSRRFASYLGLTPREHSSGLRRRLGGISKRGDAYLRTLLIHGARSVLYAAKRLPRPDRLRAWALGVERLRGHHRAAVALANKLARISWAVWRSDRCFEARGAVA
jgi:transposase